MKTAGLWVTILLGLSILGCSETTRYKVLSFFFDGVPPTDSMRQVMEEKANMSRVIDFDNRSTNPAPKAAPVLYFHSAYRERRCNNCHEPGFGNQLLVPRNKLCFECHSDFAKLPGYVHGPVAVGACTTCHNPHKSSNKFLLKRTGINLCAQCHEDLEDNSPEHFQGLTCTYCHDPHSSSESPLFLRFKRDST